MKRSLLLSLTLALIALAIPTGALADRDGYPGKARYSVPLKKMDRALACAGGKKNLDGSAHHQPVLLVHGTGVQREQNWDWNYWPALPEAGFETCWVQLPDASLEDIQVSSEYVARAVQVMARKSGEKIDVLGHSQGGLQPRWAIKWFPSGLSVGDYMALASPNHGTEVSTGSTVTGGCFPSCWQMRPTSKFIAALNRGDETPGRVHYTSIYTTTDELVQPTGTQALEGAVNILIQDVCPGRPVDHASIAGDGFTYEVVLDALTHRGPANLDRLPTDVCQRTTMPGTSGPPPGSAPDYTNGSITDHEPPLKPYAR